ncbi:MAG: lipopolysaccharide heptosyltransferase II [Gemmataceae bacterium]
MNVAAFLPNWIGDAVMATPAIRALRALATGKLIGVCRPYVADVFDGAPWFDDLMFLDRRAWSQGWPGVAWKLRREQVDVAVLFPNSFRVALAAWLGKCKRRIGFRRYLRGGLLTDGLDPVRDADGGYQPTPIIDDYNRLAMTAGTPWPGHRLELFTTATDEAAADSALAALEIDPSRDLICLNPGAAFGSAKHWYAESFATLARDLAEQRHASILVLCGPGERDMARQIAALAAHPAIHHVADQPLSLGLTKALVRRCQLLVTTDSGPRHFAAAFERPVVTLFGPTHIAWTETYFDKAVHVQKKVPCGPCQQRVCPQGHHQCMRELTPAEVFAAASALLARQLPHRQSPAQEHILQRRAS